MRQFIFYGLLLCASNVFGEGINLREGLWHIDVGLTGQGKGPQSGPIFVERCISPNNIFELTLPPNTPCKGGVTASTTRKVNWHMTCKAGNAETQIDGIYEFNGEKFIGEILSRTPQFSMEIKTRLEGRYLGPCPDAEKPIVSGQKQGSTTVPKATTPSLKPYEK